MSAPIKPGFAPAGAVEGPAMVLVGHEGGKTDTANGAYLTALTERVSDPGKPATGRTVRCSACSQLIGFLGLRGRISPCA